MVEAAINSADYSDKLSALAGGQQTNQEEAESALLAKLSELEAKLAALNAVGELTIEDILAKIKAGDAANAEEL